MKDREDEVRRERRATERRMNERRMAERRTGGRRASDAKTAGEPAPRKKKRRLDPSKVNKKLAAGAAGAAAGSIAVVAGATAIDQPPKQPRGPGTEEPVKERAAKGVDWDLTVTDHDRVDFFTEFLMGEKRADTKLWLERVGKYGPMIRNELAARDMPQDLMYLTMIESGFDPNAYSHAHAAGLWQFIEETAERYGLEVSEYVDERRDPVKSTHAALTYLDDMHDRFDSWYLAAAGYNTGEGRVGRLMREITGSERGSDEQYWTIWDRLPRETRDYVPLMLAAGHIGKEPEKYGFDGLELQQPYAFEEVIVPGGTKLADVADAAGADIEAVRDLNAHLVKGMTPPARTMAVRVPVGSAKTAVDNLAMDAEVGETYRAD